MALCVATAAGVVSLGVSSFSLHWTHSVERTEWQEDWRIAGGRLVAVESRVRGSGAGMEPGDDARLTGGWWRWQPDLSVGELSLANSDTAGKWTLCTPACAPLGGPPTEPIRLFPCSGAAPPS